MVYLVSSICKDLVGFGFGPYVYKEKKEEWSSGERKRDTGGRETEGKGRAESVQVCVWPNTCHNTQNNPTK